MASSTELEHVPRTTFFWVLGTIITAQTIILGAFYSIVNERISETVTRNEQRFTEVAERIKSVEARVDSVDRDIRTILVGIEQVKARLGIVEIER